MLSPIGMSDHCGVKCLPAYDKKRRVINHVLVPNLSPINRAKFSEILTNIDIAVPSEIHDAMSLNFHFESFLST